MAKVSKKYGAALKQIDREKRYSMDEGFALIPKLKISAKFDETVDIAVRLGVDVATLLEHNESLNPNRIRAGQRLFVPESRPAIDLEVERGDSLARIAARHEVTVAEILRWNPAVRRNGLRAGRVLRLYSTVPLSRSESIGLPYNGSLVHPVELSPHPLYVIRESSRA